MLHINTPKRIYLPEAIYFVTTVTRGRYPYFHHTWMAEFAVRQFAITKGIVPFLLYAYVIMPNHMHALIQPKDPHTISQIMHVYKRHLSRNIRMLSTRTVVAEDGHLPLLRERGNIIFAGKNPSTITLSVTKGISTITRITYTSIR